MRYIGIITAINSEYKTTNKAITKIPGFILEKQFHKDSYKLSLWSHNRLNIIVIKTGAGYNNAKRGIVYLLQNYQIDTVINPGIAGAINPLYSIGDLFLCNSVINEESPQELIQIDNKFYPVIKNICKEIGNNFFAGKIITVKRPLIDSTKRNYIYQNYHADVVDMEIAAIAEECNNRQIPLVSIKTISDMADDSLKIFNVIFSADGKLKIFELFKLLLTNPLDLLKLIKIISQNFKTALLILELFLIKLLKTSVNNV